MPNRILKETVCTSEEIDGLTVDEERFFYRLLVKCDDFGRMDARSSILKASCYPLKLDDITCDQVLSYLSALTRNNLITLYIVDEKPYLQFNKWEKHQQKRAKHSKYPSIDAGVLAGDIICDQVIANVSEKRETRNEKRDYENTRDEKAELQKVVVPYQEIKDLYNRTCGNKLSKVMSLSDQRKKHIKARYEQFEENLATFELLFQKTVTSPFLTGNNDRNWKADFDWLIKNETNPLKVLEGKYDNSAGGEQPIDRMLREAGVSWDG